jgi:D-alanyl-D-alanine carboxypeptidase (penicillin-binding protein 5/6)
VALALLISGAARAQAPQTSAPRAIVMEVPSGRVLFEKNADAPTAPASLAKLMTVEIVLDRIKAGALEAKSTFTVGPEAAKARSGAFIPLKEGSHVTVDDLLQALIVQSANNAALVVAEGIAGSAPAFVNLMNRRAREIGLGEVRFANPNGVPGGEQRVTMRAMAALGAHLVRTHPEHYARFGQRSFTFAGETYRNRNPLLDAGIGADGLKTGQTQAAGFALVASAEQNGRRLVLAMNGLASEAERKAEALKLLAYGFSTPR